MNESPGDYWIIHRPADPGGRPGIYTTVWDGEVIYRMVGGGEHESPEEAGA